jgi:hypothetical protein
LPPKIAVWAKAASGATNQKGPQAPLHAICGAGKWLPVNLVFVAEGEEEIGSPYEKAGLRH